MDKKELIQRVIENNGGIAKTSDFAKKGIKKYEVAALCKKGIIKRIRRGFYQLPGSDETTEEQLIYKLLPQGIICVESALFHYGYSDFSPREWSIAVPRTASRAVKNIEEFPMKALRLSLLRRNMQVLAHQSLPVLKILVYHLPLISVLVMSLYRSRKSEKSLHSLMILLHRQ